MSESSVSKPKPTNQPKI